MKEYAKTFYKGAQWRTTSRAYLISQHYLCERCGEPAKLVHHKRYITKANIDNPDITLNWDNLEALCQDCHNAEHRKVSRERRYSFNADGELVEK